MYRKNIRIFKSRLFSVTQGCLLVFIWSTQAFAVNFLVEPATTQIIQSDIIIEGTLVDFQNDAFVLQKIAVLKGNKSETADSNVLFPTPPFIYNKEIFARSLIGQKAILFIAHDQNKNILTLNHYQYSIWPQGLPENFLKLNNVDEYRDFIVNIQKLDKVSADQNKLIQELFSEKSKIAVYAAIDYTENQFENRITDQNVKLIKRLILTSLIFNSKFQDEPFVVDKLVSNSQDLPFSVVLPRLNQVNHGQSILLAHLKAHGLAVGTEDHKQIELVIAKHILTFRIRDARGIYPLLHSKDPIVLHKVYVFLQNILKINVGNKIKDIDRMSVEERIQFWEEYVVKLES